MMSVLSRTVYINNFLTVSEGSTGTRLSEVNQYWGGGSRINLNCFCTFLFLLCVFLIQMEIIGGGGGGAHFPTALRKISNQGLAVLTER